ncbi:MAG: hypothetical protein MUC99_05575, partial [Anaerolineae bacterium]|nr:hypothetical protein [Anaerolineae bacterium]
AGTLVTLLAQSAVGGLDPALGLFSIDGTPLAQSRDISSTNRDAQITNYRLPNDGEYVIVVRRSRNTRGSFSLIMTQTAGTAVTATPVATTGDSPDGLSGERGCETLRVGCVAIAQPPTGRTLNLRAQPEVGAASDVELGETTEVLLVEGPILANGFRWWRVELADGQQGWLVERLSLTRVLTPAE